MPPEPDELPPHHSEAEPTPGHVNAATGPVRESPSLDTGAPLQAQTSDSIYQPPEAAPVEAPESPVPPEPHQELMAAPGGSGGAEPPPDDGYHYGIPNPDEAPSSEEEEGGPVKTFLEHLEDLRWTLIKIAGAISVGFAVCLFAANNLVGILKWPLDRAAINRPGKNEFTLTLMLGTNFLGTHRLPTNHLGDFKLPTNHVTLELTTVQIGSNHLLTFQVATNPAAIPTRSTPIQIINLGPAAGFIVAFQIAFYGGAALAMPFILYFLGQFILPALKRNEKRYVLRGLAIGSVLFFLGVTFCYFFLMPMVLALSFKYSQWLGFSAEQWRAEEYIGFVCKFMLGMGLGFEQPLVILMLVKLGIFTATGLKKFRPYMVVINLVLGAVLTTPEVITQITMFIPLQLLYEVSILIASYWERQEKKRDFDVS